MRCLVSILYISTAFIVVDNQWRLREIYLEGSVSDGAKNPPENIYS